MKQKLLVLMAIMMAAVSPAWAYVSTKTSATIDGIVYNLYPNGDAEVGENPSFEGTSVSIPAQVTYQSVKYNVTAIAAKAFYISDSYNVFTNKLTEVTLSSTITSIGDQAFYNRSKIKNMTIPSGVKTIGKSAFYYCKEAFTDLTLPNVTSLGEGAFQECSSMKTLVLSNSITTIPKSAFKVCFNLTSVTIPDGVTKIDNEAFKSCRSLTEMTLPKTVSTINPDVFYGCDNLKKLYLLNPSYVDITNNTYYYTFKGSSIEVVYVRKKALQTLSSNSNWKDMKLEPLPNITYYTNDDNEVPLTVTTGYGEKVTYVGSDFVEENGEKYFYHEFTGDVTTIPANAFSGQTTLTRVDITGTVDVIGDNAFSGCSSLTSLVMISKTAPTDVSSSAFTGTHDDMKVYVREVAKSNFGDTWQEKTVEQLPNIKYTTTSGIAIYPKSTVFGANVSFLGSFYDGVDEPQIRN